MRMPVKRFILYAFAVLLALCVQNMLTPSNAYGQQSQEQLKKPRSLNDELLRGKRYWIVFDFTNSPAPPQVSEEDAKTSTKPKINEVSLSSAWSCSRKLTKDDYRYLAQAWAKNYPEDPK